MYNCTFLSFDVRYYKEEVPSPPRYSFYYILCKYFNSFLWETGFEMDWIRYTCECFTNADDWDLYNKCKSMCCLFRNRLLTIEISRSNRQWTTLSLKANSFTYLGAFEELFLELEAVLCRPNSIKQLLLSSSYLLILFLKKFWDRFFFHRFFFHRSKQWATPLRKHQKCQNCDVSIARG